MKKTTSVFFLAFSLFNCSASDLLSTRLEKAKMDAFDIIDQENDILRKHTNTYLILDFIEQFHNISFVEHYYATLSDEVFSELVSDTQSLDAIVNKTLYSSDFCELREQLHSILISAWNNYCSEYNHPDNWTMIIWSCDPLIFVIDIDNNSLVVSEKTILMRRLIERIDRIIEKVEEDL